MSAPSLSLDFLSRCRAIETSTWSDALDALNLSGVLDGLTTRSGTERIAGQAVTGKETAQASPTVPVSEFRVGELVAAAGQGEVLVVTTSGATASTAGGLAARAAARRGVAGFILDGACRDLVDIRATGLFVATRNVTPRSGKRRIRVESINEPIVCGGVRVSPGDLVIGDETGVVVVPLERAEEALVIAERLVGVDDDIATGLDEGTSFAALLEAIGPA